MPALVRISVALFAAAETFIFAAVGAASFLAAVMDRRHHSHVVPMGR